DRWLAPKAEQPKPAANQGLIRLEGIAPGDGHDDGAGDERDQDREEGNAQRPAGAPKDPRRPLPGPGFNCGGHRAASMSVYGITSGTVTDPDLILAVMS